MSNYTGFESMDSDIGAIVREMESDYIVGTTHVSTYVDISMKETLDRIDAYINSKHISGDTDSLGREKPFFNIVTAATNIWYRATDIDRKNIKFRATKRKEVIPAFIAGVHLQDWMRRENFGSFLNEWGRTLARYGSAVTKFVEKDGRLIPSVIPWQRLIVDAIDFENNVKIEVIELTEAQLYQREGYDKEMVEKLCDAISTRKTLDGHNKDNKSGYIKLYEVHGNLPLSYLTGKEKDDDIYVQQMHVISFVASKEKGKFDDFTLVSGREEKDPYMITHLIKEDGQTLSIGAVQHLFEAQWMLNHTVKAIKDQLDLASKLIFQTSDGNFVGQNAVSAIESGDILIHAMNQPITQINNTSHDITSLQNFGAQWKQLGNEINGISEAMLGAAPKSGAPWRQTEALLQESYSLFELMTENKGLATEEMMRRYVIPYLKKGMDTSKEVSATLDMYGITQLDAQYIRNETANRVNNKMIEMVLSGQTPTPEEQAQLIQQTQSGIQQDLTDQGNQRFYKPSDIEDKTWKDIFKNFEWDIEVDVVGENLDKDAAVTLNTMFQNLVARQGRPFSPEEKLVYDKILTLSGTVSPAELSSVPTPSPIQQPQIAQPTT